MSAAIDTPTRDDLQPVAVRDVDHHYPCIRVRWAVLATQPQAETWAEQNLRQRGYNPYVPRYAARQRDRVIRSQFHIILRPLFPGYIFCQHDPRDPWRPIRFCPGIRANLLGGNGIQYAREGAVEAVQAAEDIRRVLPPPNRLWSPGKPCAVSYAPAGRELPGVVLQVGTDMATVAMMWFGALREVAVQLDCLRGRDE